MNHTQQRNKLRAVLAGSACLSPARVYDALSVLIAEAVGYEIALLAGSGVAATTLAAPDLCVHTITEYADQIRRIMRVAKLSLFVDGDTGYGNALNVMRSVQEFEHAGVSGLSIEDTVAPLQFGQSDNEQRLVSLEEAVGKLRAAVAARSDPALVIAARTPALKIEGIEGTLKRVKAYAAAGVDAIFVIGPNEIEHLQAIHDASGLPLIIGSFFGSLTREQMAKAGARIMHQHHFALGAIVKGLRETYTHLYNGGDPADLKGKVASQQELDQLVTAETYRSWLREYMQ